MSTAFERREHEHHRYEHPPYGRRWDEEDEEREDYRRYEEREERRRYRVHPIAAAIGGIFDIVEDSTSLGVGLLRIFDDYRFPVLFPDADRPRHRHKEESCECGSRARSCDCEIPPPCWEPQPMEHVVSQACPGSTATVRLRVNNCGSSQRVVKIQAPGATAVTPDTLTLGPMEHGFSNVSISMPVDADWGQQREVLVWIRGCRDHFLRWFVKVSRDEDDRCAEATVEDCPDQIHHWYDHFYCERPCRHSA